jgi:hypothetical protein
MEKARSTAFIGPPFRKVKPERSDITTGLTVCLIRTVGGAVPTAMEGGDSTRPAAALVGSAAATPAAALVRTKVRRFILPDMVSPDQLVVRYV